MQLHASRYQLWKTLQLDASRYQLWKTLQLDASRYQLWSLAKDRSPSVRKVTAVPQVARAEVASHAWGLQSHTVT